MSLVSVARRLFVPAAALVVLATAGSSLAGLHPPITLRDADGQSVVRSGAPISTMQTCGACHDVTYIEKHNYHAWLGMDEKDFRFSGRPFDFAPGPVGRFDPLVYERFDPAGGSDFDLGMADWIRRYGERHIGGGFVDKHPATTAKAGPGTEDGPDPWASARGPADGAPQPWDWNRSGRPELNCFLCHIDQPENEARTAELRAGRFSWAVTATLARTGIVRPVGGGWQYDRTAFDENGAVSAGRLGLQDPDNANCGQCHGTVYTDADHPFFFAPDPRRPETETTGIIIAPYRIRRSGMNIAGKDTLSRPWDVHAERLLECTDCHPSLNNPIYYTESAETRPTHLRYDARRVDFGQYLQTPSHNFVKGHASQSTIARDLDSVMRRCENCHDPTAAHDWLPYRDRHMQSVQCEACHIPRVYAPAREQTDWTVLNADGNARVVYRGVEGDPHDPATLIHGFEPVIVPRKNPDGSVHLSPQNLMSTWYWFDESQQRPVRLAVLRRVFFDEDGGYRPGITAALDGDGDGVLAGGELQLDNEEKVGAVRRALKAQGVEQPVIRGEIQAYGIHHGVAPGGWANHDCEICHGDRARFTTEFELAPYVPGDVMPAPVQDGTVLLDGELTKTGSGALVYRPGTHKGKAYLLGYHRHAGVDTVGRWLVLLVLLGVLIHGSTRIFIHVATPDSTRGKGPRK